MNEFDLEDERRFEKFENPRTAESEIDPILAETEFTLDNSLPIEDIASEDDSEEAAALEAELEIPSPIDNSQESAQLADSPDDPSFSSSTCSSFSETGGEIESQSRVTSHTPFESPPSPKKAKIRGLQKIDESQFEYREMIVDRNNVARQAGSDVQEGGWVKEFRRAAERNLFIFCKGVLNLFFLTESLHKPVCDFVQKVPPFRKLVMLPRGHGKTAIISGGLPLHILIQPAETNIYFPGLEGSECRIMLAGENMRMAKKNLRVLEEVHSGNKLFRALWPHRVWDQPRRQSKLWNQDALIFPRENEWPDPTIWAIGVDGAVTGARPNVQIKDDLISVEAANSDVVMEAAVEWHRVSRALMDTYEKESGMQSLEFIIGTKWAVYDLYSEIIDNDPSVEVIDESFHAIIRDGKILWPERFTEEMIDDLRKEYGAMFYLLYLNSAADPELVDFDLDLVREFKLINGELFFTEDARDDELETKSKIRSPHERRAPEVKRGTRLTPALLKGMIARREYFRARYG